MCFRAGPSSSPAHHRQTVMANPTSEGRLAPRSVQGRALRSRDSLTYREHPPCRRQAQLCGCQHPTEESDMALHSLTFGLGLPNFSATLEQSEKVFLEMVRTHGARDTAGVLDEEEEEHSHGQDAPCKGPAVPPAAGQTHRPPDTFSASPRCSAGTIKPLCISGSI